MKDLFDWIKHSTQLGRWHSMYSSWGWPEFISQNPSWKAHNHLLPQIQGIWHFLFLCDTCIHVEHILSYNKHRQNVGIDFFSEVLLIPKAISKTCCFRWIIQIIYCFHKNLLSSICLGKVFISWLWLRLTGNYQL